jgi:non-homologous end joining protein Ku
MKIYLVGCLIEVYQLASELEIDCHILHDHVIDRIECLLVIIMTFYFISF